MAKWQNYLNTHDTRGTRHRPRSALEVLALVRGAAAAGTKIRAVGSGHSSSEVARPVEGQAWVDLSKMDDVLEWPWYADPSAASRYVRVEAGITIAELNERLDEMRPPRALYNMGNYDGQTLAGAFSTGTHGSGLNHGPIGDRVVAIEMVTDEKLPSGARAQRLLRLEPEDGAVTDPAAFAAEHASFGGEDDPVRQMVLERDDEAFAAALINLGSLGIVTAVTVETRERFWLEERETHHTWDQVGDTVEDPATLAAQHPEFLQITLSPHAVEREEGEGAKVHCLVTSRAEIPVPDDEEPTSRDPSWMARWVAAIFSSGALENFGLWFPRTALKSFANNFARRAERSAEDPHRSVSWEVLVTSLGPEVDGTSCEIFVPLDRAKAALDRIVELAAEKETLDGHMDALEWFHTSPLGVRTVAQSEALLAPSFDGPKVAIEVQLLYDLSELPWERVKHDRYRDRMLETLVTELCAEPYGGRPHWGQRHWMTDARAQALYGDRWTRWKAQHARFDAYGTFANAFTARMGL